MKFYLVLPLLLWSLSIDLLAADHYVDSVYGDDSNDGSYSSPWASLQYLLDRRLIESQGWSKTPYTKGELRIKNKGALIKAGDTIWLRNGYYGRLLIEGMYNQDYITLSAQEGHKPKFRSVLIRSASNWVVRGLDINLEYGSGGVPRDVVAIVSHGWHGPSYRIKIENNKISSALSVKNWSKKDWNSRVANGVRAQAKEVVIRDNIITNVNMGIEASGVFSLVENNKIINFAGDGMRGLGSDSTFQYNLVKNSYDVNGNHDDGFQSWSSGPNGIGTGVIKNVVLRGNIIINYEDENQPFKGDLQGIGAFDGMYENWLIENNVVMVNTWHGISLGGAKNCRIINNTVVDLEVGRKPGPPWIKVSNHKNGTKSEGCIIRNNIAGRIVVENRSAMQVDHNIEDKAPNWMFRDFFGADLRLKSNSNAIDSGSSIDAPGIDIEGNKRPAGKAVDIGAFEYIPE